MFNNFFQKKTKEDMIDVIYNDHFDKALLFFNNHYNYANNTPKMFCEVRPIKLTKCYENCYIHKSYPVPLSRPDIPNQLQLLKNSKNQTIGAMQLSKMNPQLAVLRIEYLYIIPEYQNKGVGYEWLKHVINHNFLNTYNFSSNLEGESTGMYNLWVKIKNEKNINISVPKFTDHPNLINILDIPIISNNNYAYNYKRNTLQSYYQNIINSQKTISKAS